MLRPALILLVPLLVVRCSDSTGSTAAPTVDSISPSNGPLAGGTLVTITGKNLSGVSSVKIGGNELVNRQMVSATQITGTTPAALSAGAKDVVVTAGTLTSSPCAACITYEGLSVASVTPAVSSLVGGVAVTISGTNFTNVTNVTVGGAALGNRTVVSSTQITGTVPALAVGSKDVIVTSAAFGNGTCSGCVLYMDPAVLSPPISAGGFHACQLSSGVASCWGHNALGQLGDGTNVDAPAAVAVAGGVVFASVHAGGDFSCGLTAAGAAYCWGINFSSELGTGTPSAGTNTPAPVSGGITFTQLAVGGGQHTCGLTSDGAAFCWGAQPGTGTATNASVPTAVGGGMRFSFLAAGGGFTCGLTPAGAAYCWGVNSSGELGNGTTTNSLTPLPVAGGLSFVDIALGGGHACAATAAGAAYCWGSNSSGELGTGSNSGSLVPVAVAGGLAFRAIGQGAVHSCGLAMSGAAYCWGNNQEGRLGTGSVTPSNVPVAVTGGLTFTALSVGGDHACGVSAGTTVYCWGADRFEQLGNGRAQTWTPEPVTGLDSAGFTRAGPYGNYSCAVNGSGAASCWGENNGGPLGNGSGSNTAVPVPVSGGLAFTTLATARGHNCGLTATGAAYCWGLGIYGELGTGAVFSGAPAPVTGNLTFKDITVGVNHTCGLTTAGVAYCWGDNGLGQLGNGTGANSDHPVAVSGGHVFSAIAAGI